MGNGLKVKWKRKCARLGQHFIFVVAHSSREEAKKNWDALGADPEFQEVIKSEQANKLVQTVDVNVHAADGFSPMK